METQRGEREAAERELAKAEARLEQASSQSAALQERLCQLETQRGEHVGEVARLSNQITALQSAAEQNLQQMSGLEETLAREKVCVPACVGVSVCVCDASPSRLCQVRGVLS